MAEYYAVGRPGVLVVALAQLFDQVTALDPEPGRLQTGRRRWQQEGVANVRWVQGVAEDTTPSRRTR